MKTLNISKQVRITSLTPEDLNKIGIREGEAIHLSELIHAHTTSLNHNHEIIQSPGFIIQNIRENLNDFLEKICVEVPCHTNTTHRIIIDESESDLLQKTHSSIVCNND